MDEMDLNLIIDTLIFSAGFFVLCKSYTYNKKIKEEIEIELYIIKKEIEEEIEKEKIKHDKFKKEIEEKKKN